MKRRLRAKPYRGVAVVLVLAILATTLVLSYAVLRQQTTGTIIEANASRLGNARLAAISGISAGLRKIHTNSWGGVGSQITGNLGDGSSYTVSFIAGDSELTSSSASYSLLPYRVTLHSTGTATRADGAGSVAQYVIDVVVQLVPRAVQTTPAAWSKVQSYTVFHYSDQSLTMELPSQISGKVYSQGAVLFAATYPSTGTRYPFKGYIDEVAVFNKAISDTDLLLMYTTATAGDPTSLYLSNSPVAYWRLNEAANSLNAADSVTTNAGLYVSAKPGQTVKPFATSVSSAYFDGLNDHVQCRNLDVTGSKLTVLAWINPDSFTSDMRIVSKGTGDTDAEQSWKMSIKQSGTSYWLTFGVRTSNGYVEVPMNSGTLSPNTWTFVAGVYDGTKVALYKDGLLKSSLSHSGNLVANSNAFVVIGDVPPGSARCRILQDLYQMKKTNVADYCPLTQSWDAPAGTISALDTNLMQDDLKLAVNTIPVDTTPPVTFPITGTTYQLFAGGPTYSIPTVTPPLSNTQLRPSPVTNPLGIYRCSGTVQIRDNVTVQGTLLLTNGTAYDLNFENSNVTWTPVDLMTLSGESVARQLPIAIVPRRIDFNKACTAVSLRGQMVAGEKFKLGTTDVDTDVDLQGSCVCSKFEISIDSRWPTLTSTWKTYMQDFLSQRTAVGGLPYFPQWLKNKQNLSCAPRVSIIADNPNRVYHWPDFTQPIFKAHPSDIGLRWNVVAWRDRG